MKSKFAIELEDSEIDLIMNTAKQLNTTPDALISYILKKSLEAISMMKKIE